MNAPTPTKRVTVLPNGVTIATDPMPNASSVYVGLWLPTGSALENAESSGLSHFYEHLVFKGTKNRSAFQIAAEIEDLGGNMNAYTSREVTCFYIHIAKEHLQTAIAVLADLTMEPKLSASDFAKEKSVILEEIRATEDNPEELSDDFFHKAHFKGSGLEFPIAGTARSIKKLDVLQIRKRQKFILEELPILVSVAGAVEHGELLKICKKVFAKKTGAGASPSIIYSANSGTAILQRHVQQATVLWGASCEGLMAKEARALQIFNHIFGDGFSSRLFQNIREKYGLVYSINSSFGNFIQKTVAQKNFVLFQIAFATEPQNLERVADLIRREMKIFLKNGFLKNELENAKQGIIGSYRLSRDSLSSRQNRLARQVLRYGHPIDANKTEEQLGKMEADYIEAFVKSFAENSKWTFAAVVPKKCGVREKLLYYTPT
ncbi:MAG: insulinase family protein [Fibromonadaceae bacterium]|jgi:predicted Zn-dependent peptidase|nr:insulinase family protein [Fibromonadaceae bacterium]